MTVTLPIYRTAPTQWPSAVHAQTVTGEPIRPGKPSFLPNPQPDKGLYRFAVVGDAGTGDQAQMAVAKQLARWQQLQPFHSVMVLGDNVYQSGEPALFQDRIARPYQDLFGRGVRFYPVLGNHDVKKGYEKWQLAYWGVPQYYNYKLGPKGAEIEFWAIDTNSLIPGTSLEWWKNPLLARQKSSQQLAWLEQSLSHSTAAMKVVYGHHPIYSRGAATKGERALQQRLLAGTLMPLLSKYGVDLYMAGHEHHYEAPVRINGVYHVVSGAGGKLDGPNRGGTEGNGLIKKLHFLLFEMTPGGLRYQTISSQGQPLDTGFIPKKQKPFPQFSVYA